MSDEVLIEEIRTAMRAEVEGIDPSPQVLADVLAVPPRRRPRLSLGWLMPALAVGVAALVAVVAVTSLIHRNPAPRGGSAPASIPVDARGLAARLAVLRRPQRRADVLPHWAVRETESLTQGATVIASLSRLVGSVNLGRYGRARVYLVVQRPPHRRHPGPPLPGPRLGYRATIAFVGPFREEAAINGPTVAAGGEQVAADRYGLIASPGKFTDLWGAVASIVPDGVWRVKWVFQASRQITVWPHLHGNVAIGKLPPGLQIYMRGAAWYGARGQLIASFGTSLGPSLLARNYRRALQTSRRQRVDPRLLSHFALLRMSQRGVPGLNRSAMDSLIEPNPLGLNVGRDRFVDHSPAAAFVVPGAQGIALRVTAPEVAQAEAGSSEALAGGLFIETAGVTGHRKIIGLAPDGNRTVTVRLRGGGVRTAPVVDNVYALVVPAAARTLIVKNAQGRTRRFGLP